MDRAAERGLGTARDKRKAILDCIRFSIWAHSSPTVPEGEWWIDFDTLKVEGIGISDITSLTPGMHPRGEQIYPSETPEFKEACAAALTSLEEDIDAYFNPED